MSQSQPTLQIEPLVTGLGLRKQACDAIKRAVMDMDIYGQPGEIRLHERQLRGDLGVSRKPIREAQSILEQEGFVRSIPRRGILVIRKTKREIVEMVTVWAAIESIAARIATTNIRDGAPTHLTEYFNAAIKFLRAIIRLGGIGLMASLTDQLFTHMRAVRAGTMTQDNRAQRSVGDHRAIVAALRRDDLDLAERRVRDHTLDLADQVERFGEFIDHPQGTRSAQTSMAGQWKEITGPKRPRPCDNRSKPNPSSGDTP